MATKTVFITGCSSGIGRATAVLFGERGWNVVATSRGGGLVINDAEDRSLALPLDVASEASVSAAVERAIDRYGIINCVVNNAGVGLFSPFESTNDAHIRDIFEVNLFGAMRVCRAFIPHLSANGGGRLINVTSASSIVPEPLMSIYAASKAALASFSEGVRYELTCRGIDVRLVEPGFVPGTCFVANTQGTSQSVPVPPAYEGFIAQRLAVYMSEQTFAPLSDQDVARGIFDAATDQSGAFRFPLGADTREMAHMRRETSEPAYDRWVNERFLPA